MHCVIEWDGTEGNVHYAVKVTDCSAGETYVSAQLGHALGLFPQHPEASMSSKINGKAICEGRNRFAVLRDGSEIQFGSKAGASRASCSPEASGQYWLTLILHSFRLHLSTGRHLRRPRPWFAQALRPVQRPWPRLVRDRRESAPQATREVVCGQDDPRPQFAAELVRRLRR